MRPLLTLITCAAPILSAAAQPPVSSAPTLDQDKLRLLSCDTSAGGAGRQRAVQWLNGTAETLLATGVAFAVAYVIIGWFMHYISNRSYTLFVWYRIAVGLVLFVLLGLGLISA